MYVVVKNSGYEWKLGEKGQIGDVRRVHILVENAHRKVEGGYLSHIVTPSPPWSIKGGRGPLLKGIPLRSRVIMSRVLLCSLFSSSSFCEVWGAAVMAARFC